MFSAKVKDQRRDVESQLKLAPTLVDASRRQKLELSQVEEGGDHLLHDQAVVDGARSRVQQQVGEAIATLLNEICRNHLLFPAEFRIVELQHFNIEDLNVDLDLDRDHLLFFDSQFFSGVTQDGVEVGWRVVVALEVDQLFQF